MWKIATIGPNTPYRGKRRALEQDERGETEKGKKPNNVRNRGHKYGRGYRWVSADPFEPERHKDARQTSADMINYHGHKGDTRITTHRGDNRHKHGKSNDFTNRIVKLRNDK